MEKIYIRLLEGTEALAPVEARRLEGDTFEITANPDLDLEGDVTSIWEFFPSDVVKCKEEGDMQVAKELVRSSFPNRRIYQLLFKIVESLGAIEVTKLSDFKTELLKLCTQDDIRQKRHPLVQEWLNMNCQRIL